MRYCFGIDIGGTTVKIGLVVENVDSLAHAKTIALALDIPLLANCENATNLLKTGVLATLNPKQGSIRYSSGANEQ